MLDKSKKHLECVNETYLEHLVFAIKIAMLCFKAGFSIIAHAICPAVFQTTGSRTIFQMHDLMMARKERQNAKT